MIGGYSIVWSSQLQTEIALSTIEGEYIALSSALCELILFQRLLKAVWNTVGLADISVTKLKITVFEDNQR